MSRFNSPQLNLRWQLSYISSGAVRRPRPANYNEDYRILRISRSQPVEAIPGMTQFYSRGFSVSVPEPTERLIGAGAMKDRLCRNYKKVILRDTSKGRLRENAKHFFKMRSISVNLPFSINML
jgi:hypothetical protein